MTLFLATLLDFVTGGLAVSDDEIQGAALEILKSVLGPTCRKQWSKVGLETMATHLTALLTSDASSTSVLASALGSSRTCVYF